MGGIIWSGPGPTLSHNILARDNILVNSTRATCGINAKLLQGTLPQELVKSPNSSLGVDKNPCVQLPVCLNEAFCDDLSILIHQNSILVLVSVLRSGIASFFFFIYLFLNGKVLGADLIIYF